MALDLHDQIDLTLRALRLAHSRIERVSNMLRQQRLPVGLDYDRTHDELAHIMQEANLRLLVEWGVIAEAWDSSDGRPHRDGV